MRKLAAKTAFVFSLFLVVHSCVTINIYFPAAAVEKAADSIVDEVWGDKKTGSETPGKEGEPQGSLEKWKIFAQTVFGPDEVFAQEADINVTTPAIRALKDSIKDRAGSLKSFLDNGNIGISNNGLLELRSKAGLSLKSKATIVRLINAENTDRKALYKEIAKANNFSMDKVPDIMAIFAKSWIRQAKKGWLVQNTEGEWSKKE